MDEPDMQYAPDVGLQKHEWASEYASLEPSIVESPAEALPEFADLVERMLRESGIPLDTVASEGVDPEIALAWREAHRVARISADGGDVDPGDVGAALANLRDLYDQLIGDVSEPPGL